MRDLSRSLYQFREARNQLQREIVDGVIPEVLKGLESGSLAGAGHAGEDHQLARMSLGTLNTRFLARLASLPARDEDERFAMPAS